MKKINLAVLVFSSIFISNVYAQSIQADDIVGIWLLEDKSGEIEIYEKKGLFFGKLIKVYQNQEISSDINNPDKSKRNRKIIGLVVLTNLEHKGKGNWGKGKIYDPDSGKTYSCNIKMQNKNIMEVTGYVGLSVFGETVEWMRIRNNNKTSPDAKD